MAGRILITDDAAFMRHMLRNILEKAGYEVTGEAANGNECVQAYKDLRPDVAILDITMPQKDGIEAAREIRAFDPDAKIIMCSALGNETKIVEALEAGAKDFIVKPFDATRITEALKRLGV